MDELRSMLEGMQLTQQQILQRLDNIEVNQAQAFEDVQQLKIFSRDHSAKIDALRLPLVASAAQRLIGTTELLEKILWYVGQDGADEEGNTVDPSGTFALLGMRKVSKYFQAVIEGSEMLKRALYLSPEPAYGSSRTNSLFIDKNRIRRIGLGFDLAKRIIPVTWESICRIPQVDITDVSTNATGAIHLEMELSGTATDRDAEGKQKLYYFMGKTAPGTWLDMYLGQAIPEVHWRLERPYGLDTLSGTVSGTCSFRELLQHIDIRQAEKEIARRDYFDV